MLTELCAGDGRPINGAQMRALYLLIHFPQLPIESSHNANGPLFPGTFPDRILNVKITALNQGEGLMDF